MKFYSTDELCISGIIGVIILYMVVGFGINYLVDRTAEIQSKIDALNIKWVRDHNCKLTETKCPSRKVRS